MVHETRLIGSHSHTRLFGCDQDFYTNGSSEKDIQGVDTRVNLGLVSRGLFARGAYTACDSAPART